MIKHRYDLRTAPYFRKKREDTIEVLEASTRNRCMRWLRAWPCEDRNQAGLGPLREWYTVERVPALPFFAYSGPSRHPATRNRENAVKAPLTVLRLAVLTTTNLTASRRGDVGHIPGHGHRLHICP